MFARGGSLPFRLGHRPQSVARELTPWAEPGVLPDLAVSGAQWVKPARTVRNSGRGSRGQKGRSPSPAAPTSKRPAAAWFLHAGRVFLALDETRPAAVVAHRLGWG